MKFFIAYLAGLAQGLKGLSGYTPISMLVRGTHTLAQTLAHTHTHTHKATSRIRTQIDVLLAHTRTEAYARLHIHHTAQHAARRVANTEHGPKDRQTDSYTLQKHIPKTRTHTHTQVKATPKHKCGTFHQFAKARMRSALPFSASENFPS